MSALEPIKYRLGVKYFHAPLWLRIKTWCANVWGQAKQFPPEKYLAQVKLAPGDDGYEDAGMELHIMEGPRYVYEDGEWKIPQSTEDQI